MVTFTETETKEGGWGIVAVPGDKADRDFLNDNSPNGALAYIELVLSHALEAAEDAEQPRIRSRILEAIGELGLAEQAMRPPKDRHEEDRQDALPMVMPPVAAKLSLVEGGRA
jgi:hypothetical protein